MPPLPRRRDECQYQYTCDQEEKTIVTQHQEIVPLHIHQCPLNTDALTMQKNESKSKKEGGRVGHVQDTRVVLEQLQNGQDNVVDVTKTRRLGLFGMVQPARPVDGHVTESVI